MLLVATCSVNTPSTYAVKDMWTSSARARRVSRTGSGMFLICSGLPTPALWHAQCMQPSNMHTIRLFGRGSDARVCGTICGMDRARLSTTVDAASLDRARELMPGSDSRLVDRALAALIEQLEAERELAALASHPYETDPDLAWESPAGPDLPYQGKAPKEVLELARRRRQRA